ncbi:DUF4153 domain-containing protein [Fictibacillus iocasae]|uniref:DUF4153 domain-containing protein n=1 Tax=Fictibacillus iocasae TaxID=2715437 RepID=A0ABW2NSL1_9BACL
MNMEWKRNDVIFLILCTLLGILAEQSFFHGTIGISYLVFIAALYWVFFYRFKHFPFTNRRIGFFVLFSIWMLSANFFLYDNMLFYVLNQLVIPALVVLHLSLITGHKAVKWNRIAFIFYTLHRLFSTIPYVKTILQLLQNERKPLTANRSMQTAAKVAIGLLLSIPLLFIVIMLLSSADEQFSRIVGNLPHLLSDVSVGEYIFRLLVVVFFSAILFGYMQVLYARKEIDAPIIHISRFLDPVIICTILFMVNAVYVLFAYLQFHYLFSGTLQGGFTFAEYARRGFFELIAVSLINLSLLNGVITFTDTINNAFKRGVQILLTVLITASGVMLTSAFTRLSLYESVYGFTMDRVLPHSFMLLLAVIFIFTLIKVWIERLSLVRFYFISCLAYYTALNSVNVEQFVVDQNMKRYEETGKIDIQHIGALSYTGTNALITLYEKDPKNNQIKQLLMEKKAMVAGEQETWQSYNLLKKTVRERLEKLELK